MHQKCFWRFTQSQRTLEFVPLTLSNQLSANFVSVGVFGPNEKLNRKLLNFKQDSGVMIESIGRKKWPIKANQAMLQ